MVRGAIAAIVVVVEPHALHRAALEVLGEHVVVRGQGQNEFLALRVLQIHRDAALVEVVAQEGRPGPLSVGVDHGRVRSPTRLAGPGLLHLHHVRTQAGEELGAEGKRLHLLDAEDPDAVERLPVFDRALVCNVSKLHAPHSRTRLGLLT